MMTHPVTVIAPIKLAKGKTETDLLAASKIFQTDFVAHEPGVLRRELVRKSDGSYLDIVQFRSKADCSDIMKKEMESSICHAFFSIMDMDAMDDNDLEVMPSLETYP